MHYIKHYIVYYTHYIVYNTTRLLVTQLQHILQIVYLTQETPVNLILFSIFSNNFHLKEEENEEKKSI